jgi:hypothetical protein
MSTAPSPSIQKLTIGDLRRLVFQAEKVEPKVPLVIQAYKLAGRVLVYFFGGEWFGLHVATGPSNFLGNVTSDRDLADRAIIRGINLGEMLFNLQGKLVACFMSVRLRSTL